MRAYIEGGDRARFGASLPWGRQIGFRNELTLGGRGGIGRDWGRAYLGGGQSFVKYTKNKYNLMLFPRDFFLIRNI